MKDPAKTHGTTVIATVMATSAAAVDASIERARLLGADAVEVRLDAAPGVGPEDLGSLAQLPLIATCRSRSNGGSFAGSEDDRVRLLERAARTGRFRLDVELGTPAERIQKERPEWVAVLSHHDFEGTPDDLADKARALLAFIRPGQIAKLVTTARRASDLLRVRDLLRSLRRSEARGGAAQRLLAGSGRFGSGALTPPTEDGSLLPDGAARPPSGCTPALAAFAMGEAGRASRVLAGVWGSAAIWAAADPEAPGAPGQIDLATLLGLYHFRTLGPGTLVFAVAGSPVSASLSPAIHNEAFARLGLDAVYLPLDCGSAQELDLLCRELPLEGASVTAPLKVAVLRLIDEADASVARTGACNTLVASSRAGKGRVLVGHNTDGAALLEEVRACVDPRGREIRIIGAGGVARAAAFALKEAGAHLTISSRDPASGEALAGEVGGRFCAIASLPLGPDSILIQASSAPLEDPVIPERVRRAAFLLDVRYGAREGALVTSARSLGTPAVDGLGMLVRQAAAQVRLFTGCEVALAPLLEAADRARRLLRPDH